LPRLATESGGGWEIEDLEGNVDSNMAFVLGSPDENHIVYSTQGTGAQAGGQALHHAVRSGGGWTRTDVGTTHSYLPIDAVLDPRGRPHVAYFQCSSFLACYPRENRIVISTNDAGVWAEEMAVPSDDSTRMSIPGREFLAVAPDGALGLLVYEREHDPITNVQTGAALVLWGNHQDGWQCDEIVSRDGGLDYHGAVTFNAASDPAVAFAEIITPEGPFCDGEPPCDPEPVPESSLMVARGRALGWEIEEVERLTAPGIFGVAVDSSGAIHSSISRWPTPCSWSSGAWSCSVCRTSPSRRQASGSRRSSSRGP